MGPYSLVPLDEGRREGRPSTASFSRALLASARRAWLAAGPLFFCDTVGELRPFREDVADLGRLLLDLPVGVLHRPLCAAERRRELQPAALDLAPHRLAEVPQRPVALLLDQIRLRL